MHFKEREGETWDPVIARKLASEAKYPKEVFILETGS